MRHRLRERDGEIPALVSHFAAQVCQVNGWKPNEFLPDAIEELQRYAWPGNVYKKCRALRIDLRAMRSGG